jgi:YggT family protein
MFVLANLLNAVAYLLDILLTIYMYIIIARAVISWVNPDPYNPIVRFLHQVTDPVLYRVRRVLPPMGAIDLSPLVVLLAIIFLQRFLISSLFDLVHRLKFGFGG